MAVVDATYRFLYVSVGAQGSANDASVFGDSKFGEALTNTSNPLSIPCARKIPNTDIDTPLFFVADEAYPLKTYLLKPFSARGLTVGERIYNYRLSRARRTVENSFGILVNRFCILRESMQLQPECVCDVVMVCCALHNFMRSKVSASYCPDEGILSNTGTAERSNNIYHEARTIGASYNASAKLVRDKLAVYFVGPGQKSFQWKHGNVDI